MSDIFSDLKGFGLDMPNDIQIFQSNEKASMKEKIYNKIAQEEQCLYDSKIVCPVCGKDVNIRAVRTGKLKLVKTDLDLRPIYNILDPSKYDVLVCNICGYAALRKVFISGVTQLKAELLKNKVSYQYVGKDYPPVYDYDIAIERYKLALYDAIAMEVKNSEKAYLCLKIAWLLRGKQEELKAEDSSEEINKKIEECIKIENDFIKYALEGFIRAYEKEGFPTIGLDDTTVQFLIGELSRRVGDYETALRWLSEVITSRKAIKRLKDRARESKDLIRLARTKTQ